MKWILKSSNTTKIKVLYLFCKEKEQKYREYKSK